DRPLRAASLRGVLPPPPLAGLLNQEPWEGSCDLPRRGRAGKAVAPSRDRSGLARPSGPHAIESGLARPSGPDAIESGLARPSGPHAIESGLARPSGPHAIESGLARFFDGATCGHGGRAFTDNVRRRNAQLTDGVVG